MPMWKKPWGGSVAACTLLPPKGEVSSAMVASWVNQASFQPLGSQLL
jgi:flavin reductase (DIM6/NTAB) family NADH-FMN oxidoreductase RutF